MRFFLKILISIAVLIDSALGGRSAQKGRGAGAEAAPAIPNRGRGRGRGQGRGQQIVAATSTGSSDGQPRDSDPISHHSREWNKAGQFRHWCFTSFDVSEAAQTALKNWIVDMPFAIKYLVVGKELCPSSRRAHLQGLLVIVRRV
jgi:hypothetical protein